MKTVNQARTDVAAVVGRWQVDDLHAGHYKILDEIVANHKKVIVFVGVQENLGSAENPLDFPSREAMIKEHFPQVLVLPIHDRLLDTDWSKDLDKAVRLVAPIGTVTLYGGRDSFIDRYSGQFSTIELDVLGHETGTDIRREVGRKARSTADFRAGVIYASVNRYPRVFMVVDIAIVEPGRILLGNKTGGQNDWGLPGGFVDRNEALESAARREAMEETGFLCETIEYIGSYVIPDRRMGSTDNMLSALFIGHPIQAAGRIQDKEFKDLQWFSIDKLKIDLNNKQFVYVNHREMIQVVIDLLGQQEKSKL